MSKAVLVSIRPEWVSKIIRGEKTVEIRKTYPHIELPFLCYIYCTRYDKYGGWCSMEEDLTGFYGNGKVVGEFVCRDISMGIACGKTDSGIYVITEQSRKVMESACLTFEQLCGYSRRKPVCGWHISELTVYDTPKSLADFRVNHPPQSWQFIEA